MQKLTPALMLDVVRLFILSAKQVNEHSLPDKTYLEVFLSAYFPPRDVDYCISMHEEMLRSDDMHDNDPSHQPGSDTIKALTIAKSLAKSLSEEHRILLAILLMERGRQQNGYSESQLEFARNTALVLGLDKQFIADIEAYLFSTAVFGLHHPKVLYATGEELPLAERVLDQKHIAVEGLDGHIVFLLLAPKTLLARVFGDSKTTLNGDRLSWQKSYILRSGEKLDIGEQKLAVSTVIEAINAKPGIAAVHIAPGKATPEIVLLPATGELTISGHSVPENAFEFYSPLLRWLKKYVESQPRAITLNFRLDFFNTTSSKMFLEIIKCIEREITGQTKVLVKWFYEEQDEDLREAGENYAYLCKFPFELIPVQEHHTPAGK
jgi:hypothetical protein